MATAQDQPSFTAAPEELPFPSVHHLLCRPGVPATLTPDLPHSASSAQTFDGQRQGTSRFALRRRRPFGG